LDSGIAYSDLGASAGELGNAILMSVGLTL
jgi:hypothetical protein